MPVTVENKKHFFQAIETHYVGPSAARGSRVVAKAAAGKITLNWDHELNSDDNHVAAAIALCNKFGWDGKFVGGGSASGNGCVFVFLGRE